jgi:hypothetical protein
VIFWMETLPSKARPPRRRLLLLPPLDRALPPAILALSIAIKRISFARMIRPRLAR